MAILFIIHLIVLGRFLPKLVFKSNEGKVKANYNVLTSYTGSVCNRLYDNKVTLWKFQGFIFLDHKHVPAAQQDRQQYFAVVNQNKT